jgi:hypothetical protein
MGIKIEIKNVDGSMENGWCIRELKRAGYPEGTIIEGAVYNKHNHSFSWDDCVAWLGQTCVIYEGKSS